MLPVRFGFTPTASNPCVYTHGRDNAFVMFTLYVDDILRSGATKKVVQPLKKGQTDHFAMTGMGRVSIFFSLAV